MHLHSSLSAICTLLTGAGLASLPAFVAGYYVAWSHSRTGRSR